MGALTVGDAVGDTLCGLGDGGCSVTGVRSCLDVVGVIDGDAVGAIDGDALCVVHLTG